MTTYCTCGQGEFCVDEYCEHEQKLITIKIERTGWDRFKQLLGTIRDNLIDIYRYNNDPEPHFENGGTRVIIRPDRIDPI